VGVGDITIATTKAGIKAAQSVTFWVGVKDKVVAGSDTLWDKKDDMEGLVMAVPGVRA
jgi:hypothetical protein